MLSVNTPDAPNFMSKDIPHMYSMVVPRVTRRAELRGAFASAASTWFIPADICAMGFDIKDSFDSHVVSQDSPES